MGFSAAGASAAGVEAPPQADRIMLASTSTAIRTNRFFFIIFLLNMFSIRKRLASLRHFFDMLAQHDFCLIKLSGPATSLSESVVLPGPATVTSRQPCFANLR